MGTLVVAVDSPDDRSVDRQVLPVPRYAIIIMATFFVATVFLTTGCLAYTLKVQSAHQHGIATDSIGVRLPVGLITLYTSLGLIRLLLVLLAERLADMWQGDTLDQFDNVERRLRAYESYPRRRVVGYLFIGIPLGVFLWWLFILL